MLTSLYLLAACEPSRNQSSDAKTDTLSLEEKAPFTHINGRIHDPCSGCSKKEGEVVKEAILDFVYFKPDGEKNAYLCFNNNKTNYKAVATDYKAEKPRSIIVKVNNKAFTTNIMYDLCRESLGCNHNHPLVPSEITIDGGINHKIFRGRIENRFKIEDLYLNNTTVAFVTLEDTTTSYGDRVFMLINSTGIPFSEGAKISFKVAELEATVGNESLSFQLAFDAKL